MNLLPLLLCCVVLQVSSQSAVVVTTTSGQLHGAELDGDSNFDVRISPRWSVTRRKIQIFVASRWPEMRFGQAPTGQLRWKPPIAFVSGSAKNATVLAPACVQQFPFATSAFTQSLFNNPPPASENEDCLFLNVWAPSANFEEKKPVLFWLYGGFVPMSGRKIREELTSNSGLIFGTASLPGYDGTSLAVNQNIVVVTINYRTNIFGFPSSRDLPIAQNNLGFLDQELALKWVQVNIAQFGGDPTKVTIMGQSAGAASVGLAVVRDRLDTPFRAGVMLSGAPTSSSPIPSFSSFDAFAEAVGCSQTPGPARINCLKTVPATVIRNFTNGPLSGSFGPVVDKGNSVTVFTNPLERLRASATAKVPIVLGNMENDGSAFTVGLTNLTAFLEGEIPGTPISPDLVRSLYPGENDSSIISDADRDLGFRWRNPLTISASPDELWSDALTDAGVANVFRYTYGAVFADLQKFPGAGAWHSSEIGPLFGTFVRSTATPAEVTWSNTFQTAIANFVKNPDTSPAVNWPKYVPGGKTFAKLAYNGNVEPDNFVVPVETTSLLDLRAALFSSRSYPPLMALLLAHGRHVGALAKEVECTEGEYLEIIAGMLKEAEDAIPDVR
ncbi:Carboxylesterase family-domain-containing protein [Mycena alexandri]|uniref:Carboxylic ester hydrolase n=1 Tax=Mycena alexandri TaxID=1745969 RepID=A0AAD6SV97_9AGAR|nr:Carboxylesterase family-domain-containing protein [Mycena alexandri]